MAIPRVFRNGRFLITSGPQGSRSEFASCMIVNGELISHIGHEGDPEVTQCLDAGMESIDLQQNIVVPSFIDGHTHLLFFGLSLKKLDLTPCKSLESLRRAIKQYAADHPNQPRILCRGWHQPSTGRLALASSLDDLDSRPIYVEALDLHSTWCSTSALAELPLDGSEVLGDQIARDQNGQPTGLLAEGAQSGIVWPHLNALYTTEEKQSALHEAFTAYQRVGYTGCIDMAMDANAWEALQLYRERHGALPLHIAAHWFIEHGGDEHELRTRVDKAIAMHREWNASKTPDFCIVGVKLICDGVVDGCTAALSTPYPGHQSPVATLWPLQDMDLVVSRASAAGLQCAIHAIGDVAIRQAIDSIAKTHTPNARHRIEHLELATEEDAKRLGALGITASVQPVHSDPDLLKDYPKLIGAHAWERAFPYKEFIEGGCVAIGTDAPTADYLPLPNLYNATTRKSATDPNSQVRTNPDQALTISQAFHAATAGAAYSRFAETWTGKLEKGLRADFVVLDCQWDADRLLDAKLLQTWSGGQKTFEA